MTRHRTIKMWAWLAAALILAGAVIIYVVHHQKQTPIQNECTSAATPCIKISEPGGRTYRLNDFRFAPGRCIYFVSLPDNTARHYCGNYKLEWIGPESFES